MLVKPEGCRAMLFHSWGF